MTIISTDSAWANIGALTMAEALVDSGCEVYTPSMSFANYFLGQSLPEHRTVFDFGCSVIFKGIEIRNANNRQLKNRYVEKNN